MLIINCHGTCEYVFQFSSVTQSCPTLCDSMDCSTLGLPIHHQLLRLQGPVPQALGFEKVFESISSAVYRVVCSVQFSSVAQSRQTLCDPMDCSIPGFPVHHQLLEPTQTHVYCVSDAIQLFHPLSSSSPPAFNLFQHQGLFQ